MTDSTSASRSTISVWTFVGRVARHRPRLLARGSACFFTYLLLPIVGGWLLGRGYEALRTENAAHAYRLAAAVAAVELLRMAAVHAAALAWTELWVHWQSLLRANLLDAQLSSGGPHAGQPVTSAGEAITYFRDDTQDVALLVDGIIDLSAGLMFTTLAAAVLTAIDRAGALVLLLPLSSVIVATRLMEGRMKVYRAADRETATAVSGLLGDVMGSVTTIKVNHAAGPVLDRLRGLVDRRRHTAVRDRVLDDAIWAFSNGAADVGLGLVLLVGASGLASGRLSAAQLAVFVVYLGWLSYFPRMIGRVLAQRHRVEVSVARLGALVAGGDAADAVRRRELPIGIRDRLVRARPAPRERARLGELSVECLAAEYPGGAGVRDVTFTVARGEFVVVTGPIGAGKSTLLRALLGLAHDARCTGEVRWNGTPIADRGAFMVPPQAAFCSQVPQLVSDSLADNVVLGGIDIGWLTGADLDAAMSDAIVDGDVAAMPDGAATRIGPRGLRLSGGQRQRVAAARALVHRPELVVFDDVSSALDVETEIALWDRLAAAGMTVIAVSHREVALQRADLVIRMDEGRVAACSRRASQSLTPIEVNHS